MYALESPRKRSNRIAKRRSRTRNRDARVEEYIEDLQQQQQQPHRQHQHQHQDHNSHGLETVTTPNTYPTSSNAQLEPRRGSCEVVDKTPSQTTHVKEVVGEAKQQSPFLHLDVDESWRDLMAGNPDTHHSVGSEMSESNAKLTNPGHLALLVDRYSLMAAMENQSAPPGPPGTTSYSSTESDEDSRAHVWRETPLQVACFNGCSSAVSALLPYETDLDGTYSLCASSPLHIAALRGHVTIIKQLVQHHGASVCWTDFDGNTPFHMAAKAGQWEAVQMLADMGADVNAKNAVQWTAMHYAASANNAEMIQLLISLGARTQ